MLFQVIATFEDGNQDIFDIEIGIHDENKFLYEILDAIDYDVKNLIKLSICHIAKNKYEKLHFKYQPFSFFRQHFLKSTKRTQTNKRHLRI